jgi:hypothetical protein
VLSDCIALVAIVSVWRVSFESEPTERIAPRAKDRAIALASFRGFTGLKPIHKMECWEGMPVLMTVAQAARGKAILSVTASPC